MSEEALEDPAFPPDETALAVRCLSSGEAFDSALVILAMNLPYWHFQHAGNHELYVERTQLDHVSQELQAFREEQASWRPANPDLEIQDYPLSFYIPYVIALGLTLSFILQHAYAPGYGATARMDTVGLIARGEWWRPITALCVHGDIPHLLGNLIFGLWYGTFVNRGYGAWLGWSLVLLSGVLGNALIAWYRFPESHYSVGASTAVFGALGLLIADGLSHRWRAGFSSQLGQLLIPMVAGGILLGWTGGFNNPQIDAPAHVAGFLTGIALGLLSACISKKESRVH